MLRYANVNKGKSKLETKLYYMAPVGFCSEISNVLEQKWKFGAEKNSQLGSLGDSRTVSFEKVGIV